MHKIFGVLMLVLTFLGKIEAKTEYALFAKINFSNDGSLDESDWINTHGEGTYLINSVTGSNIIIPAGLLTGDYGEQSGTLYPENVIRSCHYIDSSDDVSKVISINGLDPNRRYNFKIFCSKEGDSASDNCTTAFFTKGRAESQLGEFLVYDETFVFTESSHGFHYWEFASIQGAPTDWRSPYDYESGLFYERYHIIDQPTDRPAQFQYGVWQDHYLRESLSDQVMLYGPGDIAERSTSASTWWELDAQRPIDFSRPYDFTTFGIPMWSDNNVLVSDFESVNDWADRSDYMPMTLRATIVGVANGCEFSGWDYWIGVTDSINPVGNTENIIVLSDIIPTESGEIQITISKLAGQYGYVNAMIIEESTTVELIVDTFGRGNVDTSSGDYTINDEITLSATAEENWVFDGWIGDIESLENPISIVMSSDVHIMAKFAYDYPENIVAKVNFTRSDNFDMDGWTNLYNSRSFPADLGNGISLSLDGSTLNGTSSGEDGTMFPSNVGGTNIMTELSQDGQVEFMLSGLIPNQEYSLFFFSSRESSNLSAGTVRSTSFSIGNDTVTVNSVGNKNDLLAIEDVVSSSSGEIVFYMHPNESYAYFNALVVGTDIPNYLIPDKKQEKQVVCFPQPVCNKLIVSNLTFNSCLVLFNSLGIEVASYDNVGAKCFEIDMSRLKTGIYFLQITDYNLNSNGFKVIKQ